MFLKSDDNSNGVLRFITDWACNTVYNVHNFKDPVCINLNMFFIKAVFPLSIIVNVMWDDMHLLPVLMVCQPIEKRVLACTMYMVTGLWLSGPEPQDSCTVVSVMSVTTNPSGGPGGPGAP